MTAQEIENLLKDQKAFFAAFPDIKSFSEYRNENGDNLFHIMQRESSPAFVKRAYNHYAKMDKQITDKMLIERNNAGNIPAKFDFPVGHMNPDDYTPSSNEDKRHYENYRLLKMYTKKAFYPSGNSIYYAQGTAYAAGISNAVAINDGVNGFSMVTPTYPTIRLVAHDYSEKLTNEGFSGKRKRKTQYINYRYNIEQPPAKKNPFSRLFKPRERINQGEILEIADLPVMKDVPLSKQLKDVLFFPEDYAFAAKTLDNVGTEIKMYHGSEIMEPVIRDFKKDGGVIQIENTELKHLNTTGKTNDYMGLNTAIYGYDPLSGDQYLTSIVSMNAKYDDHHTNKFSTLAHELTHHTDLRDNQAFSQSQLMDYMMALYCANPDLDQSLYGNFKGIADGYQPGHFNEEALANLVSQYRKDEFADKTAKIFSQFAEARANNDDGAVQFIMQQSHKYVRNREFLDAMVADFKQSNTSSRGMDAYHARYANKPEMRGIINDFMRDMDTISYTIDGGKLKSPVNIGEYDKQITGYSENEIDKAFWNTSEKLNGASRFGDKYRLLAEQCKKTASSGLDKIETYKLVMIVADIENSLGIPLTIGKDDVSDHKKTNSRMMPNAAEYDFTTPGSFEYIERIADPRQLTGILRNANKLRDVIKEAAEVPNAGSLDIKIALQTSANVSDVRASIDRAEKDATGKTYGEVSKMLTNLIKADAKENDPKKRLDLVIRTLTTVKELYKRKGQEVPPDMDINTWDLNSPIKNNVRLCRYDFFNKEVAALQKTRPEPVKTLNLNMGLAYARRPTNGK